MKMITITIRIDGVNGFQVQGNFYNNNNPLFYKKWQVTILPLSNLYLSLETHMTAEMTRVQVLTKAALNNEVRVEIMPTLLSSSIAVVV